MGNYSSFVDQYQDWYVKNGNTPGALGYGSSRSQEVRFSQFVRFLDLKHKSVLDLGCGFSDLYSYLVKSGIELSHYTGIEPVPEFFNKCKDDHSLNINCSFFNETAVDYLIRTSEQYDVVVACGIFNSGSFVGMQNRDKIVKQTLNLMWAKAKNAVAYNMENGASLADCSINLDPGYWLNFTSSELTTKILFASDYHDSDFTIVAKK